MLKIRHFNQSIIPFILSKALLTVFQLAKDAVGGGNAFRVTKHLSTRAGRGKSKFPSNGQTGSWHYLRELGFASSKASIQRDRSYLSPVRFFNISKGGAKMHKQSIVTKANPRAEVILQSFENLREQFRQSLISQNYAEGTISPHIRCINVLSEAMTADGLKVEELDESLAVEVIAKTGWMGERNTYPALIVKRFVRFLCERGVAKAPNPPTAKETARDQLRCDYSVYLRRQRGLTERSVARLWRAASKFLDFRFGEDAEDLSKITSSDVVDLLKHLTTRIPQVRDKTHSSNLRSFFQYLFQAGKTAHNLSSVVPSVAQRYGHVCRVTCHLSKWIFC
jgi:hypothetical protein